MIRSAPLVPFFWISVHELREIDDPQAGCVS
jgi:hypothetical protein